MSSIPDVSKVNYNGVLYNVKDAVTRGKMDEVDAARQQAIQDIQAEGQTQTGAVTAEGTAQKNAVTAEGTRVLGTIPNDYTALAGDVGDLKSAIDDLDNGLLPFHPNAGDWYRGYFNSTGTLVSDNTNAAPTNTPFQVASGDVIKLFPEGLVVQVQTYTYSGGAYTRVTNVNYLTDQIITFSDSTYVAIHVRKSNSSTLPLSDVTTKIYFVSNIEKKIDSLNDTVDATNTFIGNTPMGTDASTLTGAIAEHGDDIADIESKIGSIGYKKGSAVTFQTVNNASSFVLDKPTGKVFVESTDAPIFTGTINNIDLLGIKQGVFTDSTSGVTIEVSGNEVYIHGTTTAGFRFDFQQGQFYTDSFANHPANLDILPVYNEGYALCFWEISGYSMPSNIYVGVLNNSGTSINSTNLSGHSRGFYKNGTYIALYSNAGISNINVKFTLGLKAANAPGTIASIEAVAKADYNTTVINRKGTYQLGQLTWTGESTQYEAYQLLKENELTKGHTFVWFGDSISQLRELPNLVSALIGATVYDCSFAGAPLTYGDPTKYQPTGFMSLCSQIVAGDFEPLSDALDAQEQAGINVTEKRIHLATLQNLDFSNVTDIVVLAGTNDFDNDYVNATNFVSGFSYAIETLLTAYPQLVIHVLSPIWRGDKSQGTSTIPTMPDLVNLEKTVANNYNLPFADLYHTSGINSFTATVFLENDILHLSAKGDEKKKKKCAKLLLSN